MGARTVGGTGIYFRPWIGASYGRDGLFRQRVLILGEAHYKWDRKISVTRNLTRD